MLRIYAKQREYNKKCLALGKVCTQKEVMIFRKYVIAMTKFPDNSLTQIIKWLKFADNLSKFPDLEKILLFPDLFLTHGMRRTLNMTSDRTRGTLHPLKRTRDQQVPPPKRIRGQRPGVPLPQEGVPPDRTRDQRVPPSRVDGQTN